MSATSSTFAPPVMEARRWLDGVVLPKTLPLLNVSQAAPVDPPPRAMREAMAEMLLTEASAHLYGPVLGLPALRAEIASQWQKTYAGEIHPDQVAITAGCNQAFAAALATLTAPGDEVLAPTPWYFNHKMWCDMAGVQMRPLPTGRGLLPDPDEAARALTPRTRAIVLVTPNNPGGTEYPADLLRAFYELAQSRGIALILDETYRDFHAQTGAPHGLFEDPDWPETLIQLYSFSKAYRLTGHRVGAMVAAPVRLSEAEKFLDTVSICPPQLGQHAALWGMQNLSRWLAGERNEILKRREAMETGFADLPGWQLLGSGAYFAYAQHPFDVPADNLAPQLVPEAGILLLPGTMFRPNDDPRSAREIRIAFANIGTQEIAEFFRRLSAWTPGTALA